MPSNFKQNLFLYVFFKRFSSSNPIAGDICYHSRLSQLSNRGVMADKKKKKKKGLECSGWNAGHGSPRELVTFWIADIYFTNLWTRQPRTRQCSGLLWIPNYTNLRYKHLHTAVMRSFSSRDCWDEVSRFSGRFKGMVPVISSLPRVSWLSWSTAIHRANQESLAFLGPALNQISWCDVNSEQRFIKTGEKKKIIDAEDSCPLA